MKTRLIIITLGILICHSYFSITQEKITRGRYGSKIHEDGSIGDRFTCTLMLVSVECAFNFLFAMALNFIWSKKGTNKTPYLYYPLVAISNIFSTVSSNVALRFISYPTQVIAKSTKPIPVMTVGVLFGQNSYPLRKYMYITMIVIGVAIFMYKIDKDPENSENSRIGQLLILFSLFMNGITSVIQDRIATTGQPSPQYMMMWTNAWCTLVLAFIILISDEWRKFMQFTHAHPEILKDLILISSSGAVGQLFIFMMIRDFGSLPCSIITTVRKFFAVLFSIMVFGNSLSSLQWFGATLVFTGLFADILGNEVLDIE